MTSDDRLARVALTLARGANERARQAELERERWVDMALELGVSSRAIGRAIGVRHTTIGRRRQRAAGNNTEAQ